MTDQRGSGNHEKDFWEKNKFNLENSSQQHHLFEELSATAAVHKSSVKVMKFSEEGLMNSNMFQ